MKRYVEQLIEDLKKARRESPPVVDFGETYEAFEAAMHKIENTERASSKDLTGVDYKELPPPEKLTIEQMKQLIEAIVTTLGTHGTSVDFPGKVPVKIQYIALRDHFKDGFYPMPGWHIDFCTGWCAGCIMADYCDTAKEIWTQEELEEERKKRY